MYKHKNLPTPINPPINTAKVLRTHKERGMTLFDGWWDFE